MDVQSHKSVDLILYPESYLNEDQIVRTCELAKKNHVSIVTGYKDHQNLDRVLIINKSGEVILDRSKSLEGEQLNHPSKAEEGGITYGYLLCMEVFQGLEGLRDETSLDIIFNPIGVGMFSEEQYSDWSGEASKIAMQQEAVVIGASHADGSYRNCGFSIPIAYCFDKNGEALLLSKNDLRTRIIDTNTNTIETLESLST
nr:hypothetical protein [Halobacillus locisalis]